MDPVHASSSPPPVRVGLWRCILGGLVAGLATSATLVVAVLFLAG